MSSILLIALAVSAALIPVSPLRAVTHLWRTTLPIASGGHISDNNRKHKEEKQEAARAEAERAQRAQEHQKLSTLLEIRAALLELEGTRDWRAAQNQLHVLDKQLIDPDVLCLESAARTAVSAKRWGEAAGLASQLRRLQLAPSESRAASAMVEALARQGALSSCLGLINDADQAELTLAPSAVEAALGAAAGDQQWAEVLALHRRIDQPCVRQRSELAPQTVLAVVSAQGLMGQWRQAVHLAMQASRGGSAPPELWGTTAAACAECASTSRSAARTAHRLLKIRPNDDVADAAIRALGAAQMWDEAVSVATEALTRPSELAFTDPRAWDAAVAASDAVDNRTLAIELGRYRQAGGSRHAHASVLLACAASEEWELALAHLPSSRPLSSPADEVTWIFAIGTAVCTHQFALAIDILEERLSSLSTVSAPVLKKALQLGIGAAANIGRPDQGLKMLAAAAPQADWPLWERAIRASIDAGASQLAISALVKGHEVIVDGTNVDVGNGAAATVAPGAVGDEMLGEAISAHLVSTLAAPTLRCALADTASWGSLSSGIQGLIFGMQAAERTKACVYSVQSGGPELPHSDFTLNFRGRRSAEISVGSYINGLRDVDPSSTWLQEIGLPPRPSSTELISDVLSLADVEPTTELRSNVKRFIRSSRGLFKKVAKKRAAGMGDEETNEFLREVMTAGQLEEATEGDLDKEDAGALNEAASLLEMCWERNISLSYEADLMASYHLVPHMLRLNPVAPRMTSTTFSMPGYIAQLISLNQQAGKVIGSSLGREVASQFLTASGPMVSFLTRYKEGAPEQRALAYEHLSMLLMKRQEVRTHTQPKTASTRSSHSSDRMPPTVSQVQLHAQVGGGVPFMTEAHTLNRAEPALEILRMVAMEPQRPEPRLLSRLMTISEYTAGAQNAIIHAFVEAGGRPTGNQLALAHLGALGVTHAFNENGASIVGVHNVTTMRAAWYELKDIWQLANRPTVRAHLWPELGDSDGKETLEPLQDIMLFGVFAHIQFLSHHPVSVSEEADFMAEVRDVLGAMSLPSQKVDALLHGHVSAIVGHTYGQLSVAFSSWFREGGWNVERRMFAPLLTRIVCASGGDMDNGARLGASGQWEYHGTITPRFDHGLRQIQLSPDQRDPALNDDALWAERVRDFIFQDAVVWDDRGGAKIKQSHLLWRALDSLQSAEALEIDAKKDAQAMQMANDLFGLDVSTMGVWCEEQKKDLRAGLLYMKGLCDLQVAMNQAGRSMIGERKAGMKKSQGFGGSKPSRKTKSKSRGVKKRK